MLSQIQRDLEPFKEKGISQLDVAATLATLNDNRYNLRCKILNRRVYFSYQDPNSIMQNHPRLRMLMYACKLLCKHYFLPDVDFVISLHDSIDTTKFPSLPAPVFTFARNKHHPSLVLFPDPEAIGGYSLILEKVEKAKELYPFDKKIKKAFWRGATTGGIYSINNWKNYPRAILTLFSEENPSLLDAKFTHVLQTVPGEPLEERLSKLGLIAPPVSVPDHLAYKYLVDIDGNSCTYSRLVWILHSNSLCLKQESPNELWYYSLLQPYVHYLPFKEDMSDFAKQFAWAELHPKETLQMIDNANTLAKEALTQEDVFQYIYELLKAYALLQRA